MMMKDDKLSARSWDGAEQEKNQGDDECHEEALDIQFNAEQFHGEEEEEASKVWRGMS